MDCFITICQSRHLTVILIDLLIYRYYKSINFSALSSDMAAIDWNAIDVDDKIDILNRNIMYFGENIGRHL